MRVWLWKIIAVCGLIASVAFSVPFTFTYSGRLLDSTTGQPISGTRSIKITFWTAQTGGSQLAANSQTGVTNDTYSVTLASGVFSQTVNLSAANFHTVFPDSTTGTWVQVQDMTAGVTYPRQQFSTVPYALKVPVDGTTITYNSSGSLQVNALSSSNLPATINSTNVAASGYMGVGRTTASSVLAKFEVEGNRSFFAANSEQFSIGAKFNSSGGAVYFGAASSSATPDAVISNAGGATLMKLTDGGNAIFGDAYSLANTLRYLDISNLDQTSTGSGVNLRLITRNIANTGNVAVDMVKYRNGGFYINNNETDSNAFTSLGVGGTERMRVTSSGNLGIGTTSPQERLRVIDDSANYTGAMVIKYPPSNASTSLNYVGQWSEANTLNATGALNNTFGSVSRTNVSSAGSTMTGANGLAGDVYLTSSRNITSATGVASGVVNSGTGTISNAYSVTAAVSDTSTGTITNGFGVYVGNIEATNKWGVYSTDSAAANVLMGNTGIGTNSPAAKLDVAGEVKFGNTSSTCNATNEGQQRYNSTLKLMQFCNGTTWETVGARAVMPIIVTDEKAVNTGGGSITANTWTTRTLNTIKADPGGYVSLASNQLTFAPGSYKCIISAPSYKSQFHQIRWYNVTSGSVHAIGAQDHSEDTDFVGNRSFLHTYFQISASTTFRVEHVVNLPSGGGTNALGVYSPWTTGTYTIVDCLRLGY